MKRANLQIKSPNKWVIRKVIEQLSYNKTVNAIKIIIKIILIFKDSLFILSHLELYSYKLPNSKLHNIHALSVFVCI